MLCYRAEGISRYAGSLEVKRSGGAGMILGNVPAVGRKLHADPHFVPATAVSYEDANIILKYIKSRTNPTATIVPPITIYGSRPAPAMANFSSRGPNPIDPHILKVFLLFIFTNIFKVIVHESRSFNQFFVPFSTFVIMSIEILLKRLKNWILNVF